MNAQVFARLLLTASVVSVLASCGDAAEVCEDIVTQDKGSTETVTASAETEDEIPSLLPSDLDFGGREIRILNNYYFERDGVWLSAEEENGDLVNDAIYKQNADVESQLNVRFQYRNYCRMLEGCAADMLDQAVTAGSDDYDLVAGVQWEMVPKVVKNIFVNLDGAEYLHLDQPWWYQEYIRDLSVGADKNYFLIGDFSLGVLRNMSCMYVNKELYQQHFGDTKEIYREVLDGKWTMDVLAQRSAELYQDLNGDGKRDADDCYGLGVVIDSISDHFTFDAGIRVTERDEDHIPYLVMNNERTVDFTKKLYSLYHENVGTWIFTGMDFDDLIVNMPTKFHENQMLYLPGWFYTSELLRDMHADYAIIPFPKLDENQETYLSLAHDIATVYCIPTTCGIVDEVTAVMESMALEGYKTVLPAYYEVALKVKYNRDSTDEAIQVIDLIHDHATTDFAYIYNYAIGQVGTLERDLMKRKKSDFASVYAKREKSFTKRLNALIESFQELE